MKGAAFHLCDAVGKHERSRKAAVPKCFAADRDERIGKRDGRDLLIARKRFLFDVCDAVGNDPVCRAEDELRAVFGE